MATAASASLLAARVSTVLSVFLALAVNETFAAEVVVLESGGIADAENTYEWSPQADIQDSVDDTRQMPASQMPKSIVRKRLVKQHNVNQAELSAVRKSGSAAVPRRTVVVRQSGDVVVVGASTIETGRGVGPKDPEFIPNTIGNFPTDTKTNEQLDECTPSGTTELKSRCSCGGDKCVGGQYCFDGACHDHAKDQAEQAEQNMPDLDANNAHTKIDACTASDHKELASKCSCDGQVCAKGKYCFDDVCHDHARGHGCTESDTAALESRCKCSPEADTNECARGKFCYKTDDKSAQCFSTPRGCADFEKADGCPAYCEEDPDSDNCRHQTNADGTRGGPDWWEKFKGDEKAAMDDLRKAETDVKRARENREDAVDALNKAKKDAQEAKKDLGD